MHSFKPVLYMVTAAFLFCFTEIALKILNGSLNALELNFSRYFRCSCLWAFPNSAGGRRN